MLEEKDEKNKLPLSILGRMMDRQATILVKQNEILKRLDILDEIMKGVKSLYQIGVYFKTTMETFQMIDAKMDWVMKQLEPTNVITTEEGTQPTLVYDEELAKGRVGKKYMVGGQGPWVLSGIRRRIDRDGKATLGFAYTFLAKDNPNILKGSLVDLSDADYEIRRVE